MITIDIDAAISQLRAAASDAQDTLETGKQDAVGAALDTAEDFVRATAQRHRVSGAMEDNIKRRVGHLDGEVVVDVKHASFLDEGTDAHRIEPKPGGVLAFRGRGGGLVVTRQGVNHPGTTGIGFKAEAERRAQETGDREAEVAAERAADRLNR